MTTLKASGNTQIQKLAGAIAGNIRQEGEVQISLVGASALNQAIKACIVARRFLKDDPTPSDIAVQPEFLMQNFSEPAATENREVTTIMLHIHKVEFDPAHAVSSDVPHHEEGEATL
ncbi:MAG TPA: stage V sporulation protein S [Candidatus Enterosoma merdigallinarum]|nr:stage V sporulation protein S [Candidatus Enterosoma merdigallinarum]